MNKDELKAEAKKLGIKVRDNFMDDAGENAIVLAIGIFLGYVVARMFF